METPAEECGRASEDPQELSPVVISSVDLTAFVAARRNVPEGARVFETERSGHDAYPISQNTDLTLLMLLLMLLT